MFVKRMGQDGFDLALEVAIAADLAIVHEQVRLVAEGMAIGARQCGAGRGPHMGKEQAATDLAAEAAQVLVGPGGQDFVIDARLGSVAIPAQSEAITIGLGLGLGRVQRLVDQRMGRGIDQLIEKDRRSEIGEKAAHDFLLGL